jgi:hypothetical protein
MFSPCTRLRDIIDQCDDISEERKEDFHYIEEFHLHVSTEEFRGAVLEREFTYADLHAMLDGDCLVWFTPALSAAVFRRHAIANIYSVFMGDGFNDTNYSFLCDLDGLEISATASSSNELLEMFDILLRLVAATSDVHSVKLSDWRCANHVSINATSLAYLMEQCQSLQDLTLLNVKDLDEDQIRVLGANSRPDLEIALICCQLTSAGTSVLAEVLGRNQGPTKLEICDIDYSVLAGRLELSGNSSLKRLAPRSSSGLEDENRELQAIAGYLRQYRGLIELDLSCYDCSVNDETWDSICNSLKAHPTLEVLQLSSAGADIYATRPMVPAVITSRVQALLDMMKVNMIIHTISLRKCYSDHELFRGSVIPYLKTNRLRPRLLAIQKARPIPYRAKLLGAALLSARTDANSFWMLLSGNPEVAFLSRTTAIPAAAKLPTPATATTTENASAVTVTATTTGSLSTADASAPGAAAPEKRNALMPLPLPLLGILLLLASLLFSWLLPLPLVTNAD